MSSKLTVVKLIKVREPYHGEYDGKPYTIYEAEVDCTIDGSDHSKTIVKSGKEAVINGLAEGQTFWADKQDRKGFISYKLGQPVNLSAPQKQFQPRNEKSIIAQSSLKAAVDMVIAYPTPGADDGQLVERTISVAEELMTWVESKGK